MAIPASSDNKFDSYLLQIKQKEQRKRKQRMLTLTILLTTLVGGFLAVQQFIMADAPEELRTFAYEEMNSEKFAQLLKEDSLGIILTHPEVGADTIDSPEDYQRFQDLVSLMVKTNMYNNMDSTLRYADAESWGNSEANLSDSETNLPVFQLEVRGNQMIKNTMTFAIQDYDPSLNYFLDFGNGVRRNVTQRTRYAYPLPGNYTLRLIATSPELGSSISIKNIAIQSNNLSQSLATAETNDPKENRNSRLNLSRLNRNTQYVVPRSAPDNNNSSATVREPGQLDIIDLGKVEADKIAAGESSAQETQALVYAPKMPQFQGGKSALSNYINRNLKKPTSSSAVEGRVVIQCVVKADGSLTDLKVLRSHGEEFDQEALRLVQNMPNWIPGESEGVAVPVYKTITINFDSI